MTRLPKTRYRFISTQYETWRFRRFASALDCASIRCREHHSKHYVRVVTTCVFFPLLSINVCYRAKCHLKCNFSIVIAESLSLLRYACKRHSRVCNISYFIQRKKSVHTFSTGPCARAPTAVIFHLLFCYFYKFFIRFYIVQCS